MFEFLLFAVATVGMTAILVEGAVFAPLRDHLAERTRFLREKRERLKLKSTFAFSEFLEGILTCFQCCGFWSGLFCGIFLLTSFSEIGVPERRFAILHTLMMWFCCGVAGSLFAHVYYWCMGLIVNLTYLVKSKIPTEEHHHRHAHSENDAI